MDSNTRIWHSLFVFLLVVFSVNFFSATFAHEGIFKNLSYAYSLAAIVISIPFIPRQKGGLTIPILVISLSMVFSIFMSFASWGQDLSYSVSLVPYLLWFVFFFLVKIKYPIDKLEKVILIYGLIYVSLFLFQLLHNEVVYFGYRDEFVEDRGIIRIDFPGGGIFYLSFFIALNRATSKIKWRWFYICFAVVGLTVTVLQVTRQSIALVFLITIFHLLKGSSAVKKAITLGVFVIAIACFFASENSISTGLVEKQKETVSEGDKYIRVMAGQYFLEDFSPDIPTRFFGNGFPNNTSDYGKHTLGIGDKYGYFLSDLGLVGFYIMFGILPVLAYIFIFIRCFRIKTPENFSYLKYYLFFILLTCFTSDYSYSLNYIVANVFALYCFQMFYKEKATFSFSNQLAI